MSRYARQMALPDIGPEGQVRLTAARVLVIGAGGLGCPVLTGLAGAGVGALTLLDPDVVEESNLHRQPLYRMADLGQPKALAAAQALQAAHPEVRVEPQVQRLTPANAAELIAAHDLILDCADSYAVTYTLSDLCLAEGKPLISASALGFGGYVGGFCGPAPSYRALFPDLPAQAQTCATAGVLGPVVAMVGAMQAQLALAQLLGLGPNPLGQMITADLRSYRFASFRFDGAPEPAQAFRFIAASQITASDRVIDLRPVEEAPVPAHASAQRSAPAEITPSPQRSVLACRSGLRAWRAAVTLAAAQGHDNIVLLAADAG